MAQGLILKVKNTSGATIDAGKVVYVSGLDQSAQVPTIDLASNNDGATLPAVGITMEAISNNSQGSIRNTGIVSEIDTSNVAVGSDVYVGSNGSLVFSDPSEINNNLRTQQLGVVILSAENGQIYLFPMELRKLRKHAATHEDGGDDEVDHGSLPNLNQDHHPQYILANGTRQLSAPWDAGQNINAKNVSSDGIVMASDAVVPPTMTQTERDSLTPSNGWIIINSTTGKINFYFGGSWRIVTST